MTTPLKDQPAFPFPSGPEPRVNEFHDRAEGLTKLEYTAIEMLKAVVMRGSTADMGENIDEAIDYANRLFAELEKEKQ